MLQPGEGGNKWEDGGAIVVFSGMLYFLMKSFVVLAIVRAVWIVHVFG